MDYANVVHEKNFLFKAKIKYYMFACGYGSYRR